MILMKFQVKKMKSPVSSHDFWEMCCVSGIKKSFRFIINSKTQTAKLASKEKIDLIFHLVSRADAGSANLGMTHRDKAKYSCAHLPQQTEQVNTVTWLYITVSVRGWDALI